MSNALAKITANGDGLIEMVLGMIDDVSDAQLTAVASIVVGQTVQTGDDTFEIVLNGPAFAPVPLATFFAAFQTFLVDMQRAGLNERDRAAGRDAFQRVLGPMAALIDWSE